MPIGPGKYDEMCTDIRIITKAAGVLLIVLDGDRGSGFRVRRIWSRPSHCRNCSNISRHKFGGMVPSRIPDDAGL